MRALACRFVEFTSDFSTYFDVARRNVSGQARSYLTGLLMKAPRKNMERMEEYVEGCDYQSQQQFLSDSPWDHRPLMNRVAQEVSSVLGGANTALLIDESGFAKKGSKSAGVDRQWNGRLGKVDNCQVGVFAALSNGSTCGLIDAQLYLPESWTDDPQRCSEAKIPAEHGKHLTKTQIAMEMIRRAKSAGIEFGWVGFDALYGSTPWLLREVEEMGVEFVADVRSNHMIYQENPSPYLPQRQGRRGAKPTTLHAQTDCCTIGDLFVGGETGQWEEILVRNGTKGAVRVTACRERVWLWNGEEKSAHCWWAVCVLDEEAGEAKFFLSNASEATTLEALVRRHSVRYWVERGFQDGKTSLGMADYQARGWIAWHHHMALVMLAMLFLLRERQIHLAEIDLLSCQDVIELLNVFLPRRDLTAEAVIGNIARRHRSRRKAIEAARRSSESKHRNLLPSVVTK